jgi:hypothetical protein
MFQCLVADQRGGCRPGDETQSLRCAAVLAKAEAAFAISGRGLASSPLGGAVAEMDSI